MKRTFLAPARLFGVILLFASILTVTTGMVAKKYHHWGVEFQVNDSIRAGKTSLTIEAIDLLPEPGEFTSDEELQRFYSRQKLLSTFLKEDSLTLTRGEDVVSLTEKKISFTDLPLIFWIQIIVGLGATIIAGWIWSLRPKAMSSTLFFLSGLSTLCFTYSAAIYTTRELFIPIESFKLLVGMNVFGASLFGITTLALFLIYPSRFKFSKHLAVAQAFVFGSWTLLSIAGALPVWAGVNLITMVEMLGIVLAICLQFFLTRERPKEKAALTWLGLSIMVGAGGFISLNALPLVFGIEIPMAQAYAFLLFLAFYGGLAAGIGKYRLFDVGNWAYRFLFYSLGAVFLVLLDVAFLTFMKLDRLPALGLSFFLVGFLYLPLRDWIQNYLRKDSQLRPDELIEAALFVVLSPNLQERIRRWENLLRTTFKPVELISYDLSSKETEILDEGAALLVPSIGEIPSYIIRYRNGGKSLFNKEISSMVGQLVKLIIQGDTSRSTYERGVKEERKRIARDLHDDVGARLLTGLHAEESDLRSTIQGAITDIRTIVKGIAGEPTEFSLFIAEIRAESARRAEESRLNLDWPHWESEKDFRIDYHTHKTISSVIREIFSNVIKHSRASSLVVKYNCSQDMIEFSFEDNGQGISGNSSGVTNGQGLMNMKSRIEEARGEFHITDLNPGVKLSFKVPL